MKINEQLSIRRMLLAVLVAAAFVKVAESTGLLVWVRNFSGLVQENNAGWISGALTITVAVAIWLGYAFWFGIVVPGTIERYWASRKLRTKRREGMMKSLAEFEQTKQTE